MKIKMKLHLVLLLCIVYVCYTSAVPVKRSAVTTTTTQIPEVNVPSSTAHPHHHASPHHKAKHHHTTKAVHHKKHHHVTKDVCPCKTTTEATTSTTASAAKAPVTVVVGANGQVLETIVDTQQQQPIGKDQAAFGAALEQIAKSTPEPPVSLEDELADEHDKERSKGVIERGNDMRTSANQILHELYKLRMIIRDSKENGLPEVEAAEFLGEVESLEGLIKDIIKELMPLKLLQLNTKPDGSAQLDKLQSSLYRIAKQYEQTDNLIFKRLDKLRNGEAEEDDHDGAPGRFRHHSHDNQGDYDDSSEHQGLTDPSEFEDYAEYHRHKGRRNKHCRTRDLASEKHLIEKPHLIM